MHKCLVGMSKHLAEAGNELGSNEQSFESVVSFCFFVHITCRLPTLRMDAWDEETFVTLEIEPSKIVGNRGHC